MRRKRKRAENTGISRETEGKKKIVSVGVMIKRFMGVEGEGAGSSHSHSSFCLL